MRKYFKPYTIVLMLLLISGCTVSKESIKPKPPLPVQFRDADPTDSSSVADISKNDFFTDPLLLQLIDSAVIRNYDAQAAIRNIEAAQLTLVQKKYARLPDVRIQAGAGINRPSDNSLNGISLSQFLGRSYIEDYSTSVGISWEADIWGKIRNQKAVALAGYLQTQEARKAIQTQVVADVARGYYNLLMLDEQLRVARKNVVLNDSALGMIRLQYTAGQVTQLAVQQAEAQLLAASQLVPLFEQQVTLQENALSILAGALPGRISRSQSLSGTVLPSHQTGYPAQMVSRRPDVRSQELAVSIAHAQTGIAKAALYPSLSITVAAGVNAFKASNWFNIPASLFGSVVGGITQPIFQKKELQTRYEIAKVNREKAVIQFRQSVLQAVGEVSDALASIEKLKEQQAIATARQHTLQNAIVNANLLFRNGMASYIEVLYTQGNALQAELETATLTKARLTAHIDLYKALGGGWK